jgi:hypothetical protein
MLVHFVGDRVDRSLLDELFDPLVLGDLLDPHCLCNVPLHSQGGK